MAHRLILFAYYYPPLGGAGSQRALSIARHLPNHGWEVVVVTPREGVFGVDASDPGGSTARARVVRTGTFEPAVLLRKVLPKPKGAVATPGGSYVEEVHLGAVGSALRDWARGKLYFPDSCRGWISHAVRAAGKAHREAPFDAVLSSSPPVSAHVAARKFARLHGLPWVADWRDLWTDRLPAAAGRTGEARTLETELLRSASAVTAPMDGLRDRLREKRGEDPVLTVRNGFEPEQFDRATGSRPAGRGFQIVYTGTIHGPDEQFLGAFLEAVRRVTDGGTPGRLTVRVLGKVHPGALEMAASAGVTGLLELEGFQSHRACLDAMAGADLLLLLATDKADRSLSVEVPAKTYEYLAARRPILALDDPAGETAGLLQGRRGVWVCPFRDATAIESALRDAMALKNPVLPAWPDIDQFTRASQAAKLAGVLDRVVAEGKR